MSVQRYGRWVRFEAKSAGGNVAPRVINLDNVSTFYKGPHGASFQMVDGDCWDTTEPFEDVCWRVMVAESSTDFTLPAPPLSRDQLAMFPERVS